MLIAISIVAFAVMAYWLFFARAKPLYHKNILRGEILKFLQGLEAGADGTILLIGHQTSDKFIQFVKHIEGDSKRTFSFGFPDAPWSRTYFEPLKRALDKEGIKYTIIATDSSEKFVKKFLDIYDISDASTAEKIALIALDVMEIEKNDKFTIHYEGYIDHEENKLFITERMSKKL